MTDTYNVHVLFKESDGVTLWLDRSESEWTRDPKAAKEYLDKADARTKRTALLASAILLDTGPRYDGLPDVCIKIASRPKKISHEPDNIL